LKVIPIENEPARARDYLNDKSLQIGRILPVGESLLGEYFATGSSFILLKGRAVDALFSYNSERDKQVPTARFRVVTDSVVGLKEATRLVEEALKALDYTVGASLPGVVSLDGRRFDYHLLYKDLSARYKSGLRRSYAKPGMYKAVDVEKAKTPKLKVRGYRSDDRPILDKFVTHQNVIRGIGSGVFEGLYPWPPVDYQRRVEAKQIFPIVCEDELIREPVGVVDLFGSSAQFMQHSMGTGIYVRADYQGLGVGTMLMEASKTLAMRLHLGRVWLSVFEGNSPALALYRKTGFEESGRVPGWLQEGYVDEVFMTLKLE